MADAESSPEPRQYLCSLRQHVREPLDTAIERVEQERSEVALECTAFEKFADRVATLSPASPTESSLSSVTVLSDPPTTETATLRQDYRDTVMAVPHYGDVYGESLMENVVAELGPDIATLFQPERGSSLVPSQQRAIVSAANRAAADCTEFCETLDNELSTLRSMCDDITVVLDELNSSVVPAWYQQQFENRLTEISSTRQSQLEHRVVSYLDGHNLCESLYHDDPHTYPVLTAVARLLDSVTIRT